LLKKSELFVAEGVFLYLKEAEVKQIIIFIQQKNFLIRKLLRNLLANLDQYKDIPAGSNSR